MRHALVDNDKIGKDAFCGCEGLTDVIIARWQCIFGMYRFAKI
jgi:hypothetical protein